MGRCACECNCSEFRRGCQICNWRCGWLWATLHGIWGQNSVLYKSNTCSLPPSHLTNLREMTLPPRKILGKLGHHSSIHVACTSVGGDSCEHKQKLRSWSISRYLFNSYFMHVSLLPACMSVHLPPGYSVQRGQKRTLDPLELGL